MDPKDIQAAIEAIKSGDAQAALDLLEKILVSAAGGTPSASSAPPPADGATENADAVPPPPGTAMASKLAKLFGVKTEDEVLAQFRVLQLSVSTLSADKDAAELDARREMIAELVKLGIETPATAWEGEASLRKPCKRLSAEPVADMRVRLAALRAVRPVARTIEAPDTTPDVASEVAKLSPATLSKIKEKGLTPEQFIVARSKATRRIV